MTKLKLTKALSWSSGGITATRDAPFVVVPDSEADALLASGYFTMVSAPVQDPQPDSPYDADSDFWSEMPELEPSVGTTTKWDTWNVKKLKQYAQTHGIDLHGATTKAAIVAAIVEATEPKVPDTSNGDPTMIALQES